MSVFSSTSVSDWDTLSSTGTVLEATINNYAVPNVDENDIKSVFKVSSGATNKIPYQVELEFVVDAWVASKGVDKDLTIYVLDTTSGGTWYVFGIITDVAAGEQTLVATSAHEQVMGAIRRTLTEGTDITFRYKVEDPGANKYNMCYLKSEENVGTDWDNYHMKMWTN